MITAESLFVGVAATIVGFIIGTLVENTQWKRKLTKGIAPEQIPGTHEARIRIVHKESAPVEITLVPKTTELSV